MPLRALVASFAVTSLSRVKWWCTSLSANSLDFLRMDLGPGESDVCALWRENARCGVEGGAPDGGSV